jgi:hypothetical protein
MLVRNIPYGECLPRSPENTLKHNKGTCSTKNILLRDLYKAIGIPTQIWLCSFEYKQSKKFTPNMNKLLAKPLTIYHTFIKIKVHNTWIIVDASNDSKLGVPYQKTWDGKSDTLLAVKPLRFFHTQNPEAFKEKAMAKRTKNEKEQEKKFMPLFFQWIDKSRK